MKKNVSCKNCVFARPVEENDEHMRCQRFPPQVQVIPQQDRFSGQMVASVQAISPPVPVDYWCGEFRPWGRSP